VSLAFAALEAAWRAVQDRDPGLAASRLNSLALLVIGLSAAAGLGLLIGGARPAELLHLVYAVLAFAVLPIATSLSARWTSRRRAVATVVAALVALVVLLRLFGTG
jgi:hypothetical protein